MILDYFHFAVQFLQLKKGFCGTINCSNFPANMFSITFDTEEQVIDWLIEKMEQESKR